MSNVFETIGTDVLKGVEAPFKFIDKAEQVLATAIKDEPELKTVITTLVQKASTIGAAVTLDVSEKGVNLIDDATTLSELKDFFTYFNASVVPVIESVYGQVKTDVAS